MFALLLDMFCGPEIEVTDISLQSNLKSCNGPTHTARPTSLIISSGNPSNIISNTGAQKWIVCEDDVL